jgi:hypothetical protein
MLSISITFRVEKQLRKRSLKMKRALLSGFLGMFILGSAFATSAVKYTFTDVQFVDASGAVVGTGTIQAGVKTTRKSTVVNCGYFTNPNDQFAGEFEAINPPVNVDSASAVQSFCEANFANRQVLPK